MRIAPALFLLAAALAIPEAARADVAPPNTSDCQSKKVGDVCKTDDGTMGTCVGQTCTRVLPGSDGGSTSYPCNVCTPMGGDAGADGGPPPSSGGSSSSGCSVGRVASGGAAPVALFGAIAFALARARRRRR